MTALPTGNVARRAPRVALLIALGLPGVTGCFIVDRATVGVDRVGPERVDEQLNQNALTGDEPSSGTLEVLHYFNLVRRFEEEPDRALGDLHRAVAGDLHRSYLFALAELAYLRAKELDSRDHYLASAVYAYFYLLGEDELEPASAYDRRFRWACDLYNRGLREAFLAPGGREMALDGGRRALPVGSLEVAVDRSSFPTDDPALRFVPADDYSVWGLSVRLRDSGLGAPLVARRADEDGEPQVRGFRLHAPATIFLRVAGGIGDLEQGVAATLELHSSFEPSGIDIGGRSVPLESDFSTALAFALDRSSIWQSSSRGFFRGEEVKGGLVMVRPYEPGLVPVVFVHGTASNPANWAEMFNLLQAEPEIRERTQFWFFQYATGLPIGVSARLLREALREAITTVDPGGDDDALQRMVIVGHSQGGLLAKMMAVDADLSWWEEIAGAPIEELGLSPEQEQLLSSTIDFDPVPEVKRVIFLATPHRGSFLADRRFSRWIAKTIALPGELTALGERLLQSDTKIPGMEEPRVPTSLDNMRASNPYLQRLERAPIAPGIAANSICAIGKDGDPDHPDGATDGVVAYSSAHLEGAESELLIRAGHSCQSDPRAIREVRRILLLHLGAER